MLLIQLADLHADGVGMADEDRHFGVGSHGHASVDQANPQSLIEVQRRPIQALTLQRRREKVVGQGGAGVIVTVSRRLQGKPKVASAGGEVPLRQVLAAQVHLQFQTIRIDRFGTLERRNRLVVKAGAAQVQLAEHILEFGALGVEFGGLFEEAHRGKPLVPELGDSGLRKKAKGFNRGGPAGCVAGAGSSGRSGKSARAQAARASSGRVAGNVALATARARAPQADECRAAARGAQVCGNDETCKFSHQFPFPVPGPGALYAEDQK